MAPARRPVPLLLAAALLVGPACDKGGASKGDAKAKTEAQDPVTKTEGGDKADAKADEKAASADKFHPDDAQLADKRSKDQLEHDAEAVKKIHDEMATLLTDARKLVEGGDLKGGIAKYEALLELDPHYRPCLIELGEVEAQAENWAAAIHHTKLAAKLTSHDDIIKATLYDRIGQCSEKLGKKDDAAHYYRESLKSATSTEVQGRLDGLGDVAPEPAQPPPGPPGSVDSLHHFATISGTAEDVCGSYGEDSLCVAKECNFIASEGDDSWGVFEVGDGVTNCYHPAVRTGDKDWHVYASALMDSHGAEVHQGVDRLDLALVEAEGGPYFVIRYADHLYERVWAEDLAEDEVPPEDVIDAEGMIVCQRVEDTKTRCTEPIITSLDFAIGTETGKFSAKVGFATDAVVLSEVVKQGKADAAVRAYFEGVLLDAGPHTLPNAI